MTDTPGWASPSSSEQPREDARPPADAPAAVPGQSAPPQAPPTDAQPAAPRYTGREYGAPQAAAPQGVPPYTGPNPWNAAQSPKPGIIPLRPLGFGEMLDGAVTTIRKHWRTTLGLSLGVAVLYQGAVTAAEFGLSGNTGELTSTFASVAAMPVGLLLNVITAALLTMVVSRAILGQEVTLGDAWRDARPRLLQLLGLTLLTALIGFGILLLGFLPLIGYGLTNGSEPAITALLFIVGLLSVPVFVWIWIQLSLAAPALMLEKQGVLAALSRSRRLVRGSWWRLTGINLASQVLAAVFAGVIAMPFLVVGLVLGFDELTTTTGSELPTPLLITTAISGVIASTLTIPFTATIGVLLYVDQRIRREALDIELARAAGLPEYGGSGWDGQAAPQSPRH